MAQLMPLPLTVSCFSKIQIGFTILVPAHPSSPGPLNRYVTTLRYLLFQLCDIATGVFTRCFKLLSFFTIIIDTGNVKRPAAAALLL